MAVDVFFVLSGYLISRSMVERGDLVAFAWARVLRLVPALLVMSLVLAFVLGPFVTSLSPAAYFTDPRTWLFAPEAVTFFNSHPNLPDAFENSLMANDHTGVLWTLRWEALAYVAVAVAWGLGLLRHRAWSLATLMATMLASVAVGQFEMSGHNIGSGPPWEVAARLALPFALGMAVAAYASALPKLAWALLVLWPVAVLAIGTPVEAMMRTLALGLSALVLAIHGPRWLARRLSGVQDISYGLYIWHWPVYLTLGHFGIVTSPWMALAAGLPIALGLAALSWHWVERPALSLKGRFSSAARSPQRSIASGVST
jgi:peptidoglycan/LPS O-acetylase OafA/YrhL